MEKSLSHPFHATPLAKTEERFAVKPEERIELTAGLV
jgi:hypothetical protein